MTSTIGWSRSHSANGSTSARTSLYAPRPNRADAHDGGREPAHVERQELQRDHVDEVHRAAAGLQVGGHLAQDVGDADGEDEQAGERDEEPPLDADPDGQPAAEVHRSSSRWNTDTGPNSRSRSQAASSSGDDDRTVPAAGAADRDREAGLALLDVGRDEQVEQFVEPGEEALGDRLAEHVLADLGRQPGLGPQGLDVVRVLHEPDVEHEVGLQRHAVLVAEADDLDREAVRALDVAEAREDSLPELAQRQVARVDHYVGLRPDALEHRPLEVDGGGDPALVRERVLVAGLARSAGSGRRRGPRGR